MAGFMFKMAAFMLASVAGIGAESRPAADDASRIERKADSPAERSITFHVLGLMKTKSGAT